MNLDDVVPPPGAALVEDLDKRLLVQLRDGRKIVGTLRHVFLYSLKPGSTSISLWCCNMQAIRNANVTLNISICFHVNSMISMQVFRPVRKSCS